MRHPTKRSIKKLIYLEMIILSVLLVVAVVVISGLDKKPAPPTADETEPSKQAVFNEESLPPVTEAPITWKTFPADRQLTAANYFVFDCNANEYLIQSGKEDQQVYPASITKLFTAYLICETMILNPNKKCVVEQGVLDLVAYGSSVANLKVGDTITARQLMEGMLLCSGNDAAYMLACEAGRNFADNLTLSPAEAVQVFVGEMNRMAKEKGMLHTNFVNPDGIHDPNHYTTFHDLVIMANLCSQYESIMGPSLTPEADIRLHDETVIWKNTNALIDPQSEYYCPYAIGLKTGQTASAGSCLLAAFRKDGRRLLIGVFGCPNTNDRFDDTLHLFNQIVLK